MSILIRNATIITMDEKTGTRCIIGDVLIEADRIRKIGPIAEDQRADRVIDGRNRLVMPGLINAHIHSWETFLKGRYDNAPLELWMLYAYPILGLKPFADRIIYLRSLLCAMECLKAGITTIVDDVIEMPGQNIDQIGMVFEAYENIGIRAGISGHIINIPLLETMPFAADVVPPELLSASKRRPRLSAEEFLAFSRKAIDRFHGRAGRLYYVLGPGGPQRCTPDLLQGAHELACAADAAYHLHVLETKLQAVAGHEIYGRSLVKVLDDLGVLTNRTTMAHAIWVSDDDIACIGRSGASVVHNPKSNLKLGSGIMPWRKLLDAGINVALGSDGVASNDTPRMFDVMNIAALMHKVTTPDRKKWPTADEILRAATINGAQSAMLRREIGSLEPGKKADLIILNLTSLNFTPLNDIRHQLVYCENGNSISHVIVNGEVVVEDNRLTKLDEGQILAELSEFLPEVQRHYAEIEALNQAYAPYLEQVCSRCAARDIGLNRYSSAPAEW